MLFCWEDAFFFFFVLFCVIIMKKRVTTIVGPAHKRCSLALSYIDVKTGQVSAEGKMQTFYLWCLQPEFLCYKNPPFNQWHFLSGLRKGTSHRHLSILSLLPLQPQSLNWGRCCVPALERRGAARLTSGPSSPLARFFPARAGRSSPLPFCEHSRSSPCLERENGNSWRMWKALHSQTTDHLSLTS